MVDEDSGDDPSLGVHRARTRVWWHRHLDSAERQRALAELGIKRQEHWVSVSGSCSRCR